MDYSAPIAPIPRPARRPFLWLKRLLVGLAVVAAVLGVAVVVARLVLLHMARQRTAAVIARLDRVEPGWRFEQIEAGRKVVPEAVNSATPLLAANRLFPPNWPRAAPRKPGEAPAPEALVREELIAGLLDQSLTPGLDDRQVDGLRTELAALASALAEARKVVDLPEGRYVATHALDPFNTPLPHAQDARNTARVLRLDAILRAHDGDIDGALASCRAILNVGRSLGDEAYLIVMLVRVAIETVAVRTVEHVLAVGEPSDEALAAVQSLLEVEEAEPLLKLALRGERAMLDLFYARHATGEINTIAPSATLHWLYGEAMITYSHGVVLEEMGDIIAIAGAPLSSQLELIKSWEQGFSGRAASGHLEKFSRLLLPAVNMAIEPFVASRARLRTAILGVAAARYRRKNGRWPGWAEQLMPWPLVKVSYDPFTDDPLKWVDEGVRQRILAV